MVKQQELDEIKRMWDDMVGHHAKFLALSDLEISALHSWILHCQESFNNIYTKLLPSIANANGDMDTVEDCLVELILDFEHIQKHIQDATPGLVEFTHHIGKLAEGSK